MTQQQPATEPLSKETQDCIQACMACHGVCEETMSACLQTGGDAHVRPNKYTNLAAPRRLAAN